MAHPFYQGEVARDEQAAAVSPQGIEDSLQRTLSQLDQLIAGQASRHERAIFAKAVVRSIGLDLGIYTATSAPAKGNGVATPVAPKGSKADAAARVQRLKSKGQKIPRELELLADGTAPDAATAKSMAQAERTANANAAKAAKPKRQSMAAITAPARAA